MFEWQTGNQREVAVASNRSLRHFPGNNWHTAILIRVAARTQNFANGYADVCFRAIFVAVRILHTDRWSEDARRNRCQSSGHRKKKVGWHIVRLALPIAREPLP